MMLKIPASMLAWAKPSPKYTYFFQRMTHPRGAKTSPINRETTTIVSIKRNILIYRVWYCALIFTYLLIYFLQLSDLTILLVALCQLLS